MRVYVAVICVNGLMAFVKQCRQAKISYTGKFSADVCFQYGEGAVIRENFEFGQFPVMLKVCILWYLILFL